jgi:hypothetical protein
MPLMQLAYNQNKCSKEDLLSLKTYAGVYMIYFRRETGFIAWRSVERQFYEWRKW